MQKKLGIVGHFGFGKNLINGQTIKTKIITATLEEKFGIGEVLKVDTHCNLIKYFNIPFKLFVLLKNCKNIVIFPAHRGVKVITPILIFLNSFFKRQLHYCVIGGWLPMMLDSDTRLLKQLKKFAGIYVETSIMKKALQIQGFENVFVIPNCKKLNIVKESQIILTKDMPYKLCTFSRVMREKGIEDAINAIININNKKGNIVYELDIYGQVDFEQIEWFEKLKKNFPSYIRYCGVVDFKNSVRIVKNYFCLLFPTRFYTEGIPGTIIDAYAAGVPVISSRWESFSDVIIENITGIGYQFGNPNDLENLLVLVSEKPELIFNKKKDCLKMAEMYIPENALEILIKQLK